MLWLLVERLVQVNDDDIRMLRKVKEIREDLDRISIFHFRFWRLCLNLLLRCFNECIRDIINFRRPFYSPNLDQSNRWGFRFGRGCDAENDWVNPKARVFLQTFSHRLSRCRCNGSKEQDKAGET